MIPRKRLDIGWADLLFAMRACITLRDAERAKARLEASWSPGFESVVCLSVRSGFDALLAVLDWPPGSEVLVSAATIRDMPRLLKEHELIPVPIDVDFATLSVDATDIATAITPRTRAILIAHLFGSRMPMAPLLEIARQHGLLVIEDCAQAFTGDGYRGAQEADVSMFSFGPIKTATALGGGVLRFSDANLGRRVRERMQQWPRQSNYEFFVRLVKYSLLILLSYRATFTLFISLLKLFRIDYDHQISRSVRGFASGEFLAKIRRQPSGPLIALLERRISNYPPERVAERRRLARQALELLEKVEVPGRENHDHTFWVFPILCDDPEGMRQHLAANGCDATCGTSSMIIVLPPDILHSTPVKSQHAFSRLLYLPIYPGVRRRELQRLADAISIFTASKPRKLLKPKLETALPSRA